MTETKGSSCGSKQAQEKEATRDDDTIVWRQGGVAGHHVALRHRVGTDLAGQREGAEAARDGDHLVAVTVHRLRGKNAGGGAPSVPYR